MNSAVVAGNVDFSYENRIILKDLSFSVKKETSSSSSVRMVQERQPF